MSEARQKATLARAAAQELSRLSAQTRSSAIKAAAEALKDGALDILAANVRDMERGRANNMTEPLLDRLMLDDARLDAIYESMLEIAQQADPIGRLVAGQVLESGLKLEQITVPMGVVAMIYEARPNVTADAFALCMRAGNACVLRGGSAAHDSCIAIAQALRAGLETAGVSPEALQIIESEDRTETRELMHATGLIDVLIPRGGASLIQTCVQEASVPVIETGVGNCHIYLHSSARADWAQEIVVNAKCSRPGVCNAAESLLVDREVAAELLPPVLEALAAHGVELVGDEKARAIAEKQGLSMQAATEEDWATEYLDLKISVKCVEGLDEAIEHISRYGTGHSEAIVARDSEACERFLSEVDAAAVYANASTRFTDGGVFGKGAEIGISTQRLHARGPMGAEVLTTTKYVIRGQGQIR